MDIEDIEKAIRETELEVYTLSVKLKFQRKVLRQLNQLKESINDEKADENKAEGV